MNHATLCTSPPPVPNQHTFNIYAGSALINKGMPARAAARIAMHLAVLASHLAMASSSYASAATHPSSSTYASHSAVLAQSKSESSSTSNMYRGGISIFAAVVLVLYLISVYRPSRGFSTIRGENKGYQPVAKSEKMVV